jgi:hypothetical protein
MNRFKRTLHFFALAVFLGFQIAQALHSHKAAVSDKDCAVCQIVHQTPSIAVGAQSLAECALVFEPISIHIEKALAVASADNVFSPRAPPLA